MSFVHLHVHSEYSLLDGFSKIKKLVKRAQEMGMPAVALTDHGTMFGVIEFFKAAKDAGIKPVIGLEAYLAARRMTDRDSKLDKSSNHMLLLAENMTGYKNLLKIASAAQIDGFYYYPRIDHEFLAEHSEGLIATSGCLAAEIPRAFREGDLDKVRKKIDWYYDVFGKDNFYLELMHHNIPELMTLNKALLEMGPRYNARFVATNDVHYVDQGDSRFQDILLAIQTGALLSDPNRFRMTDPTYYLRSPQEMSDLFSEVPEALSNTLLVAERCNVDLSTKGYHLPIFEVPEGCTVETYLRSLCEEGLKRRYGDRSDDPEVRKRLEYELKIIHDMGFDAYFLIVWDLCRHASEEGIWYNARGSAAGSLVAYTLNITMVEPLSHGLIFERFLNPGRISMPDIDMDFQDDRRTELMEYCARKYGDDKVAQIITFGTLGARAAIRDVGRVMDVPLSEVDRVAKLLPNIPSLAMPIKDAVQNIPELKAVYEEADYLRELIDTAANMEGVVRNAGTHAAGVIISDKPLIEYAPLHRPTSGSEDSPIKAVAQFEMSIVESLGLLKVDFLGLRTLTIMQRACELIEQRHGIHFDLNNIPLDDPETFDFISAGHTAGVFQLEGTGMTRYLVQMRPRNLANVIAMVALFRPGPMDFIPSYIRRMNGQEKIEYRHEALEPVFKETFGIPVYQEQIMFAAIGMAGYSASEADDLRKAIAKKKADVLEKHRNKFIAGSVERGIPKETCEAIFQDWENFARYGFPKAHAADYGVIAVQTAYLKTHYTVEYMTALLSAEKNDTTKVAFYVADTRAMGIDVLPPDVNSSEWDFSIEDRPETKPAIRFGLGAIKNVGQGPVDLIFKERCENCFSDLNDFVRRVDLRAVGKRALESLIKVGALDAFGPRQALLEALDRIMAVSASHFKAQASGQMSFFGAVSGMEEEIRLPAGNLLDRREVLEWERELLGLYVSDHPLSPYLTIFRRKCTHFSSQLGEANGKEKVVVAGLVTRFRNHQTKTGKPMGFVTIEDIQGSIELVIFPKTWDRYATLVAVDAVLVAEGRRDTESKDPKVLVDKLVELSLDDIPPEEYAPQPAAPAYASEGSLEITGEGEPYLANGDSADGDGSEDESLPAETPPSDDYGLLQFPPGSLFAQASPAPAARPEPAAALQIPAGQAPERQAAARPVTIPQPVVADNDGPEPPDEPPDWHLFAHFDAAGAPFDELSFGAPAGPAAAPTRPQPTAAQAYETPAQPKAQVSEAPQSYPASPGMSQGHPSAAEVRRNLPAEPVPRPFVPVSYIIPPAGSPVQGNWAAENQPRMVTVVLRPTGDKIRDVRRLKTVHGILRSSPGKDHFSLMLFERGHYYLIEFPNETTGINPEVLQRLSILVGEENVRIEPIKVQ